MSYSSRRIGTIKGSIAQRSLGVVSFHAVNEQVVARTIGAECLTFAGKQALQKARHASR